MLNHIQCRPTRHALANFTGSLRPLSVLACSSALLVACVLTGCRPTEPAYEDAQNDTVQAATGSRSNSPAAATQSHAAPSGSLVLRSATGEEPASTVTLTENRLAENGAAEAGAAEAVVAENAASDATSSDNTLSGATPGGSAADQAATSDDTNVSQEAGDQESEPVASVARADGEPSGNSAETSSEQEVVMLGDPSLTAGIPGEGPLTDEQIKAWFSDPKNHIPLQVELPMGLAAAEAQIQGLDSNPMTRAKIELGRQLYFDPRLSVDATISCASCHHPDEGFGRLTVFGVGIEGKTGNRNSPVSYNRILSGAQFWDGRAASLEDQAIGPIANPIEMGSTHDACVECLKGIPGYRIAFDAVFPADGLTIDTVAKAIATFERTIVTGPAPYDYYEIVRTMEEQFSPEEIEELKEDDPELYARYEEALKMSEPMSESARRGRDLFFSEKSNCTACHAGANFTDEQYHNIGVGMDQPEPDLGRFMVTQEDKDRGAFKTPTLRNVVKSAPYMHDGSQKDLEEVVEWYAKGGHPNAWLSDKIKKLELTDQDKADLVAFMVEGLTSDFPPIERERLPQDP